jgi:PAS domain S-box-containing protein
MRPPVGADQGDVAVAVTGHRADTADDAALAATSLAYVRIDRLGLVTDWNPAAERMFGWTRAEVLGQPLSDTIVPPALRAAHAAGFARHLVTGHASVLGRRLELPARHRDGRELQVEMTIDAVDNGAGGYCAFIHDSTGRQRAERALWESSSLVQAILDHTPAMISAKDLDGRYLFTNREYQRRFELGSDDLVGRTEAEVLPARVAAAMHARDAEVLRAEAAATSLDEVPAGDELRQYVVTRFPLFEPDGAPRGVCSIAIDDTARRHSEEALRRSEERFERMVGNVPGMMYQYRLSPDGRGTFTYVSPGCRDIYGVEPEEILADADTLASFVAPEERAGYEASLFRTVQTLEPWRWEGSAIRRDGEVRWVQGVARAERLDDGTILWDGLLVDRTRERRAEAELSRARRDLDQLITHLGGYAFTAEILPGGGLRPMESNADGTEVFGGPVDPTADFRDAVGALVCPADAAAFTAFHTAALGSVGRGSHLECTVVGYDGRTRRVWMGLRARRDGDRLLLDGVCCDVGHRARGGAAPC